MSRPRKIDGIFHDKPNWPLVQDHIDDGLLLGYQRNTLEAVQRKVIEQHLAGCADCRALLGAYGTSVPGALRAWAKDQTRAEIANSARNQGATGLGAAPIIGAVAAACAIALLTHQEPRPPPYAQAGPFGGVVTMRGEKADTGVFVPTSQLRWLLTPNESATHPNLRVFVESPQDNLRELRVGERTIGATGIIRYEVEARALLGDEFGARRVHLVVTRADPPTLLEGSRTKVERALGAHRWMTSQVEYRAHTGGER